MSEGSDDLALPVPEYHMHYVSIEGTIIIEHRDVSSLVRSRNRVLEDIRKDHNVERPQLLHTKQLNDCVVSLVKAEYNGFCRIQRVPLPAEK